MFLIWRCSEIVKRGYLFIMIDEKNICIFLLRMDMLFFCS